MSLSSANSDDDEAHGALTEHQAPLGMHRLVWGKPGKRFPKTCMIGPDVACLTIAFGLIWGISLAVFFFVPGTVALWANLLGAGSLLITTYALFGAAFSDPVSFQVLLLQGQLTTN